ncbi:transcriptional regulator [Kitasatospora sp. NBC_00240]|uniref:transcriptional regulator n=1 Tax=Kitasatospora sp. NBC_00240 TaxID=2903567 RepID=UPI00224EDA9B|nr:transcriptional regulator [Kitasatospora sp. NBC_00240]MCX5211447.1 transcriptional regulator [Kitasatospora sp. NBC_00240]
MTRSSGNTALKAARQSAGLSSQQAFATALNAAALQLGMGSVLVSTRQIRRWESDSPPWPQDDYQRLLTQVLHLPVEDLGFRAPWDKGPETRPVSASPRRAALPTALRSALPRPAHSTALQPATIGADFALVTEAHRRLYWSVAPATLHLAVAEHANLGTTLLGETSGVTRRILATALTESLLLAGRIQFFDLRQPEQADVTLVRALQAAGEANDTLLGAAVLGHSAFIPGWTGRRDEASERMQAARAYARRGPASAELLAWLDAVEAECLTRCGDHRGALSMLRQAEETLKAGNTNKSPDWLTWFSPVRLAAFKGNTELSAGQLPQARTTLENVLVSLDHAEGKQRIVVLGDLAALEAACDQPDAACARLEQALDQLSITWYATGMDRVREARRALARWQDSTAVRQIDDRLYSWSTTLNSLQR